MDDVAPSEMTEIIDAHTHIGQCQVFDLDESENDLFAQQKEHGVSATIIQPFPGAPDAAQVHKKISKLSKERPGQVYGIVSLNPHMNHDMWKSEVERMVKDEGFVGIKIHTIGHAVNPLGNDATMVFETAKKLGVPVMVHTGPGIPFALPSMVIPRAEQFPDVPIVLAHAGWGVFVGEALVSAMKHKNIYVEPSHVGIFEKSALTSNLGADRILFGTDVPSNIPGELGHFKSLIKNEADRDKVLGGNAKRIFKLR